MRRGVTLRTEFDIDSLTAIYKAGFSTVGHLKNLVTKNITKYPVLTTFTILKIIKFYISNFFEKNFFEKNWRFKFFIFGSFDNC